MSFLKEFKEFAMRGNVLDLAVGVVIGAAFGKITTSLVDQIIMPPIGLLIGGVDFAQWKWVLRAADPAQKISEVAIGFGAFINTVIQFLIIAFAVFLLIKVVNRLVHKKQAEAPAPAPAADVVLLTEIRDLLKNK
ncbi:large-conductance mechanosensitive channel protein MscL [Frateuria aurantia]|uniref:Large-conductance mechanosensitive channel n=1 Tax=Frateuria aurantia (strain ATCC 33424 / DSM 6220 / KCTC 2777 / LMG 1558 / NBRC 3245 / NCIMB 13370) TaxID=767434 RepID=H8KZN5_FRAAD|nr:large-conductance mechanosensitive channel protein MscL [Frateuria aurantia]AFC87095.1 large conductance mechanosensitive channel protein [Frateuria aurantia DSM 6220]